MSSTNPKTTPLIGDPARQAPDLHKGLVYQIWRSVEAWVNLAEDELLCLEGAEDYDVVSKTSGVTVQIKATVGNITLRSKAVISALNSFWLIKNKHQDKQIWLRFITTSPITTEKGNPFGVDSKGLEVWIQLCALVWETCRGKRCPAAVETMAGKRASSLPNRLAFQNG
jgi:hypothetical protein